MTNDLYWLSLTVGATALFWLPYVLNRMTVRGLLGTFANPSERDTPLAPWAQRAQRAHYNAVENLVIFAPAVLTAHLLGHADGLIVIACQIYFFARVAHYVVYTAGITVVRTLIFTIGWVATMIVILCVLGVL